MDLGGAVLEMLQQEFAVPARRGRDALDGLDVDPNPWVVELGRGQPERDSELLVLLIALFYLSVQAYSFKWFIL